MEGTTQQPGHEPLAPLWSGILVPVDFSAPSEIALTYALRLARYCGAQVWVHHVIPSPHALDALYERGLTQPESVKRIEQKARRRVKELAAAAGVTTKILVSFSEGEARTRVLEYAAKCKPDLIVMGTHGRSGAKRFLIGSVAEAVIRQAPCPVLTLREQPQ
jgi:universal stress protein A